MSKKHNKEDRSIKGTLGPRRLQLRSASLHSLIDPSQRRLLEPDGIASHRRALLDAAILAIVTLAAITSAIAHETRSAAGQGLAPSERPLPAQPAAAAPAASLLARTTSAPAPQALPPGPSSPDVAVPSPAPLPVLSPPVVSLAQSPSPVAASQAAAAPSPTPAPSPALPDPGAELLNAPPVAASGRLTRAQALPEVPFASGAGNSPAVAVLDQQYTDHTVAAGETLSSIAQSYGVSLATLMANNPGIDDFDLIHPGQTLRVPATNGLLYHVQAGDTLDAISHRYGIAVSDIVALKANGLQSADTIVTGQTLLLPGDIKPPAPSPVLAKALPAPASGAPQVIAQSKPSVPLASADTGPAAPPSPPPAPRPTPAPTPKPTPPVPVARFIWPIQGPITQPFGVPELGVGSPHTGVDIGLYGRDGTPIAAAAGGTVEFAGGSACCGYGIYVMIRHADGFETLYGHLSGLAVSVGQQVTQGQTVGYAGSTGFSTGTHLHFEIRLNGVFQNPLNYLP